MFVSVPVLLTATLTGARERVLLDGGAGDRRSDVDGRAASGAVTDDGPGTPVDRRDADRARPPGSAAGVFVSVPVTATATFTAPASVARLVRVPVSLTADVDRAGQGGRDADRRRAR